MKRAFIAYTVFAVIFFIFCLAIVIYNNNPVFSNFWEDALFMAAVLNLGLLFSYYKNHKHELRGKK